MNLRADRAGRKAQRRIGSKAAWLPALGCFVGLAFGIASAEDLTTTEGKTYSDVKVTKVEPDGLSITHQTGTAKVPFIKLSEELRKKHGYDAEKAEAYQKEQARKRAELDAILRASREKEEAKQRETGAESYTVTPASAEGISLKMLSRSQIHEERTAKWRMELYTEEEIERMLAGSSTKGRLVITWKRPDYDSAASEHFRVIVSSTEGKVRFRSDLEYRSPKQTGEEEYTNGDFVNMEGVSDEFRVRIVDGSRKVFADFVVRRVK